MPHFIIVLIPYINLLNLSWIIKFIKPFLDNKISGFFFQKYGAFKIPKKCHNHDAQPSRGTKGRRDKEQKMSKQTPQRKKVREKSGECHNHKTQPFPDPKRKRKPTNPNKHKSNKRTKSTKISSLYPKRGYRNI